MQIKSICNILNVPKTKLGVGNSNCPAFEKAEMQIRKADIWYSEHSCGCHEMKIIGKTKNSNSKKARVTFSTQ